MSETRRQRVMFVRSGPLLVTPAIRRYVEYLRQVGFGGEIQGLEFDFQNRGDAAAIVDACFSMQRGFGAQGQRMTSLALWQIFQLRALLRERPDVVHFCDVFSAIPALATKLLAGSSLIFDVRDNIRFSVRHRSAIAAEVLGLLEHVAARLSDVVIAVSEPLAEELPRAAGARIVVLPNAPARDAALPGSFSEGGRLVVNLAGFVSHRRNLAAWLEVRRRVPNVELDLYGNVADEETRALLRGESLECVESVPHQESLRRMASADVVSLMYDPSIEINRFAAPNKLYEAMMLGKPIVCARGMRMEEELREAGCGVSVPYGDPTALAEALAGISDVEVRRAMGAKARALFERKYKGAVEAGLAKIFAAGGVRLDGATP